MVVTGWSANLCSLLISYNQVIEALCAQLENTGITLGAVGSQRRFWSREGPPSQRSLGQGATAAGDAPLPARRRIIYTTYYESIANSSPFFAYYFFNTLLAVLQLLHVFWSYLILRMLYSFVKKGQVGWGTSLEPPAPLQPCPPAPLCALSAAPLPPL